MIAALKTAADVLARVAQQTEHRLRTRDADVVLDGFDRHVQLDGHSCGTQSTYMILSYFGKGRSIPRTGALLGTDEDGIDWPPMKRLLRARGLQTKVLANGTKLDLRRAIDKGNPVLVSLDDGGHWATVYGYGPDRVYLADPGFFTPVVSDWPSFKKRWDRWAAVVSKA